MEKKREGRPLKFENKEILEQKIQEYFNSCFEDKWIDEESRDENGNKQYDANGKILYKPIKKKIQIKPISITGMAVALDTSRQTLLNLEERNEFFDAIKKAKDFIESYVENGILSGDVPTAAGIFNLVNNWEGWVNAQTFRHSGSIITNLTEQEKSKLEKLLLNENKMTEETLPIEPTPEAPIEAPAEPVPEVPVASEVVPELASETPTTSEENIIGKE